MPNIPQFREALRKGDIQTVSTCLQDLFSIEHKFHKGHTPLHEAVRARQKAVAEFLLAQGANINSNNEYWETPLDVARKVKAPELATLLERSGGKTATDASLHAACFHGAMKEARAHLSAGADVNAKLDGQLPICIALRRRQMKVVQLLLPSVRIDEKESNGSTALHAAIQGCADVPLLTQLLKRGAEINARDETGATALSNAAEGGDPEAVEFLLEAGADIHLNAGYDIPLVQATLYAGKPEIARLLIDLGAEADIHHAAAAGNLSMVRQLIRSGVDIDTPNSSGRSPLHIAVERQLHGLAELLLETGADPNLHDKADERWNHGADTPLHQATHGADERMIRLLLSYKADPNVRNLRGLSPVDIAEARNQPHLVRLLKSTPTLPKLQQPPATPQPIPQLYTIEAAAKLLSVEADFVLNLIKQKHLKTLKLDGRVVRIPATSLAEYLSTLTEE